MPMHSSSSLGDLAGDLAAAAREVRTGSPRLVATNAREGNEQARIYARASSRRHAKEYPGTFTAERRGPTTWEYGPEHRGQGMLAGILEHGATGRNSAHRDLERSFDVIAIQMGGDVEDMLDRAFWAGT